MKNRLLNGIVTIAAAVLLMPLAVLAQPGPDESTPAPAPIAQTLVREGDFALKLAPALGLGTIADEAEAETRLGEAGIVPRNGWIADYPVTPDILAEIRMSIIAAADAKKIPHARTEALQRLDEVAAGMSLPIRTGTAAEKRGTVPEAPETYPNPSVVDNYYYDEGPPVVTYYAPPPDFYYLYSWVPAPFWWFDLSFPGFFILNDFHRSVIIDHRVRFVSNHFNDVARHRVFRVDPVARFHGRTFAGIGVTGRRGFIGTGVPRSERRIFNGPRNQYVPPGRSFGGRPSGISPGRGGMRGGGTGSAVHGGTGGAMRGGTGGAMRGGTGGAMRGGTGGAMRGGTGGAMRGGGTGGTMRGGGTGGTMRGGGTGGGGMGGFGGGMGGTRR